MNDQLQAALAALLDKTVSGIDASTAFLSAQLPDVIQQLLVWKFIQHLTSMIVPLLILVVSVAALLWAAHGLLHIGNERVDQLRAEVRTEEALYYATSRPEDREHQAKACAAKAELEAITEDVSPIDLAVVVASSITAFISLIVTLFNANLVWLQIWLAPKVYLIEYAASLAK